MIEIYLSQSQIGLREEMANTMSHLGGEITYSEEGTGAFESFSICLTVEFEHPEDSEIAKVMIQKRGIHVEGPYSY